MRSCLTAAVFPLDACSSPGIWFPVRWSHWPPPDTCNNSPTRRVFPQSFHSFPLLSLQTSSGKHFMQQCNTTYTWVQDFRRRKQWDLLDLVECWQLAHEQILTIVTQTLGMCWKKASQKWELHLADKRGNAPCQWARTKTVKLSQK